MPRAQQPKGKRTAEIVALARAAGCLDPTINNPDFLAADLLDGPLRMLLLPGIRRVVRASFERRVPGMFFYHQARTKYLDQLMLGSIQDVEQVVILGAGLDTRPYRFSSELAGRRVFEVDHPGTAAWKQSRLHRLGRPVQHITYITIDFNSESLEKKLADYGFDADAPTFFLWEGVVMYLQRQAVEDTLAMIARAASGSSVAFDYVYRTSLERPQDYFGAEGYHRYVSAREEPCLFGLDPDEVAPFLARHGLVLGSNVDSSELSRLIPPAPLCNYFGITHAYRP